MMDLSPEQRSRLDCVDRALKLNLANVDDVVAAAGKLHDFVRGDKGQDSVTADHQRMPG